jgi:hypothetical protein
MGIRPVLGRLLKHNMGRVRADQKYSLMTRQSWTIIQQLWLNGSQRLMRFIVEACI